MKISERKEKILEAIVDRYIQNPEPISSKDLKEAGFMDVSTATIRTELSNLEDMGFLMQPHTSSGRVPTAEAYRLYVEKFMPKRKLTANELKIVKRYFSKKLTQMDEILKTTTKVISEITNLTSLAFIDGIEKATIENIKIVKIGNSLALFVIVTDRGIIKDVATDIPDDITEGYLSDASNFVSNIFKGVSIGEALRCEKIREAVLDEYKQIFASIVDMLKNHYHEETRQDIVLEGSAKILEQPEYANLEKAKAMLELLDAKEQLLPALVVNDGVKLSIKITKDDELKQGAPECAIVTANYTIDGRATGTAGVIGPIRMDYSKVVSVLDYISKTLSGQEKEDESERE